ncbi:hypothetical protein OG828_22780 [Streptomyces sp. NBC_00457]
MADVVEAVTGRAVNRPARYTGPLLIVLISASCGFVIGVAVSTPQASP